MNNHYAKFEYKGMKGIKGDFRLHKNKQCKHSKRGADIIMSKFNTPKNIIKCAQNMGCKLSMCEQS